jgi:hypothetical protein
VNANLPTNFDIAEAWKKTSAWLRTRTHEERLSIFVDAGLLTPKGNVKRRFRKVIVPVGTASPRRRG